MTYTYGKSKVKKNAYDVFLKKHSDSPATYGYAPSLNDIIDTSLTDTQNQERFGALFNDNSIGFADDDINTITIADESGDDIIIDDETGYWYNISVTGNASFDMSDVSIVGDEQKDGDVLVLNHISGDNSVSITDGLNNDIHIDDVGDVAVFKWDKVGGRHIFWFFANSGSIAGKDTFEYYDYQKIGILDESPTITTGDGDSVALAEGNEVVTSETVEATATILQVTKDNWKYLRDNLQNEDCDIAFLTEDGNDIKALENATFKATFEGTGNDVNKIPITLSKETDNIDDVVWIWNTE